jgi:predicted O-linked N-acetylglucosamine transferase (SPINDLY family)
VATDLRAYRDAAVGYARDPDALRALRERLERNRAACALFDTRRFVRHLEAAYTRMQALRLAGAAPESFSVPGDSPSA